MFEALLEKNHESSIQVAPSQNKSYTNYTKIKLRNKYLAENGEQPWDIRPLNSTFLVVSEIGGIAHRHNCMQLEVWNKPYLSKALDQISWL